ncbi:hypothetical protein FRC07_011264, partial [Ceratobasidium sp. 392]
MATVELGRRHFATRRRSNNLANIDYIWNQDSLSLPVNDQPPSRALPQQRVFGARNNGGPALNNNATSPENNTENASKRPRGRRFQGNTAARPQQDNDQQARSQPPPGTGQTNNNNDQARSHLISPGPRNPTNNSSNSNANTNPGRVPRRGNSNPRRSNRTTNQASNNGGNTASGNLANNPPISKRAAKRRRARARKAEAALQEQQNAPINVVVQTRPTTTTVAPGATPALIRTPNNPPVNGPRQNTHSRTAEATTEAISRPPASTWIPPRPPVFVRTHVPPPATSRLSRTSLQEPPSQNLQPTLASLSSRLTSQTSRPISSRSSITPPPNFPDLAPRRGDLLGSVLRATRPAPVRYTAQRSNTHAAEDRASEECINRIAKTCPGPNCGRR